MKVHGWCTRCRKVKRVNVSAGALARAGSPQGVAGICDFCQQQEDDARKQRGTQLDLSDAPAQPPRGPR